MSRDDAPSYNRRHSQSSFTNDLCKAGIRDLLPFPFLKPTFNVLHDVLELCQVAHDPFRGFVEIGCGFDAATRLLQPRRAFRRLSGECFELLSSGLSD